MLSLFYVLFCILHNCNIRIFLLSIFAQFLGFFFNSFVQTIHGHEASKMSCQQEFHIFSILQSYFIVILLFCIPTRNCAHVASWFSPGFVSFSLMCPTFCLHRMKVCTRATVRDSRISNSHSSIFVTELRMMLIPIRSSSLRLYISI